MKSGRWQYILTGTMFSLALPCAFVLLISFTHKAEDVSRHRELEDKTYSRLKELAGVVTHTEEVLTMSAKMAAATGDSRWRSRYDRNGKRLKDAVLETTRLLPADLAPMLSAVDQAGERMQELEKKAFELVESGRRGEAAMLLSGVEYEQRKVSFQSAMRAVMEQNDKIEAAAHGELDRSEKRFFNIVMGTLAALLVMWGVVLITVRNYIGKIVEAQKELKSSEEKFRYLMEATPDGMLIVNSAGTIELINLRLLEMLGYRRDELVGKPVDMLVPPRFEGHERFVRQYFSAPEQRPVVSGRELFALRRDGSEFPVEINLSPLEANERTIISASIRDITARKNSEAEIKKLAMVATNTDNVVVITDKQGQIEWTNRKFEELTGYTLNEVVGKKPGALLQGSETDKETVVEIGEALKRKTGVKVEILNYTKNGKKYWNSLNIQPIFGEDGDVEKFFAVNTDISRRKVLEQELRTINDELEQRVRRRTNELEEAKAAAESANRAKSIFLANMSHEIRTPMNAILGFSQLLEQDPTLSPEQHENIGIVTQSGNHLLALINDVLDMSKIEAGKTVLTPSTIDFHAMLKDLELMFGLRAENKGVIFRSQLSGDLPRRLFADEGKLRQILVNLLGNAVKFTDLGEVRLDAMVRRYCETGVRLVLEISDTGPGISENELGALFQPFEQAAAGFRNKGGTGLGLAISRSYANLMGGDITAKSNYGLGSTFTLELPLNEDKTSYPAEQRRVSRVCGIRGDAGAKRILAVDDNRVNRLLVYKILAKLGLQVRLASDGAEAVELFEQWRPHLILMDMRMPVMDGYEAIRVIRGKNEGKGVKIFALTASAFEEEKHSILACGADYYLRKPFTEQELLSELGQSLDIEYLYEEEQSAPRWNAAPAIGPEALAAVSAELLNRLKQAVLKADMDGIMEAIAEVAGVDAPAAEALRKMAREYRYEAIASLLG